MSYEIRPAKRSEAKPLIGLYSESGCGKTWSSLMLARGFSPQGRIVMIETEGGRGEAFCDLLPGGYDVLSIRGSFSPKTYGDAISAVEKAAPAALIIDSASHEWEGADGVLSMAAANQAAGKTGPLVWQQPKMDHQRHFMLRLMATPIPLVIVCMRAKYPMQERPKAGGGKEWFRSTVLEPKQADDILFEMFIHGWIDREHRFQGTKYTRDDLKAVIPTGELISIKTGERLAAWARGGVAHETDRGATDHTKAHNAPIEAREGAASTAAPGSTKVSPPKEPLKAGDEPARGLPGIDTEDEAQTLARQITALRGKFDKPVSDDHWSKLCKGGAGTAELELADVSSLSDFKKLLEGVVAKDEGAIKSANDLVRKQVAA